MKIQNPGSMKSIIPFIAGVFLLAACGGQSEDHHDAPTEYPSYMATDRAQTPELETTDTFKTTFLIALDAYFDLKDALVESDATRAAEHARILSSRVDLVDVDGLDDEPAMLWVTMGGDVGLAADELADQSDVEEQRIQFENISDAFIEMVKAYGPFQDVIYRQTCPMVRGGSADWLSREDAIRNPYHGDRMLSCGSVVERI